MVSIEQKEHMCDSMSLLTLNLRRTSLTVQITTTGSLLVRMLRYQNMVGKISKF